MVTKRIAPCLLGPTLGLNEPLIYVWGLGRALYYRVNKVRGPFGLRRDSVHLVRVAPLRDVDHHEIGLSVPLILAVTRSAGGYFRLFKVKARGRGRDQVAQGLPAEDRIQ